MKPLNNNSIHRNNCIAAALARKIQAAQAPNSDGDEVVYLNVATALKNGNEYVNPSHDLTCTRLLGFFHVIMRE